MPEIARHGVAKNHPHCNYLNEFKLRELLLYGIIPRGPYRKRCHRCGNESNFTLTQVGIQDLATYGYIYVECSNNNCLDQFLILVNRHRIKVERNELIDQVDIASAAEQGQAENRIRGWQFRV